MLNNILVLAFCLSFAFAFSQKSPIKFGEIPMEDLEMVVYDKDSSAVALVLTDFGKAYVSLSDISATLNFERHVRIKILKKDGLSWADAAIQVYKSGSAEERVLNLKATTYNLENGKIIETKVSKDGIFKEKFNRNINLQKFTFPNVKEGSVIEYSYTISSDFLSNFPNWQFQYTIPSRHSEYIAIIPDFLVMERYMQGYLVVTNYNVKDQQKPGYAEKGHHWTIKDIPAFKEEPYMTSDEDYVSKINFALAYINFPGQPSQEIMGSWEKLSQKLLESESFGKIITSSGFLKKQTDEIIAGKEQPIEKVEALHTYVKNAIEWDGVKDYLADNPKTVFEKKKGTAGDINIALASMLTRAGFDVDMILLSTRDHGFIRKQYPMSRQFNYVVCRVLVDNKFILLDATEKFIPIDVLPERCLNGEGLIVSNKNIGWIDLTPKVKAKSTVSAELQLDETGELNGKINYLKEGYDALSLRKELQSKGQEDYIKSKHKTWSIENTVFENVGNIDKAVMESHTISVTDHISSGGNLMYINPFIESQLIENPFKLEKREYPVNYGSPQDKTYMCKITLPEGFTIDELPKSKVVALPGNTARYLYNVSQMGNTVHITSTFQINRTLFLQDEYPNLREFYNQVVAKQSEQIVLKKN